MFSSSEHHSPPVGPLASGGAAAMTRELANLMDEHHDLDTVIAVLLEAGSDDLLVSRFKKRKLQLKDQIVAAVAHIQGHDPHAHAA